MERVSGRRIAVNFAPRIRFESLDEVMKAFEVHRKYGIPDVLIDGDVHVGNMLFELDADRKPTGDLAAIIDFQV